MPNIVVPLDDVQESVERPVIFDVIRQVMDITEISSKTQINFFGDEGKASQQNSTIEKNPAKENKWEYDEKVTIDVSDDFDKENILTLVAQNPENQFIFEDRNLPVYIKPVYSSTNVVLTFKYKTKDKNQATRWRNQIRVRTAMLRDINLHTVSYHYHLQESFYLILKEVHRLRENVAPYGETFDEYFRKNITNNATVITNLSGTAGLWAIAEKQMRVQGIFDFDSILDKPEKESEQDNYTLSFTYTFRYEKPLACNMYYPLMIHNQLIGEKYREKAKVYKLEDHLRSFTASARAFEEFGSDQKLLQYKNNDGINIPSFDEFSASSVLPTTVRVLTALTNITQENKRYLFNLSELGDLSLDPLILEFLAQSEYPFLGKDFYSIFSLSLYKGIYLSGTNSLIINNGLEVYSTEDLDLRKTYRVRLGLVTDFTYLRQEAITRLRRYPLVAYKLIKAINSALSGLGGHSDIGKNVLSQQDQEDIGGVVPGRIATNFGRNDGFTLVQTLFIASRSNSTGVDNVGNDYTPTTQKVIN